VLTAFKEVIHGLGAMQSIPTIVPFPCNPKCHRVTFATRRSLQTYYYRGITGIGFVNDDESGILLHMGGGGTIGGAVGEGGGNSSSSSGAGSSKLFFVQSVRMGGSERNEFVSVLKERNFRCYTTAPL